MSAQSKFTNSPFLKLLPWVIAGVLCAKYMHYDSEIWPYILSLTLGLCACFAHGGKSILCYVSIFLLSFALNNSKNVELPASTQTWNMIVGRKLSEGEKFNTRSASLPEGKILIISEKNITLAQGDQLSVRAKINKNIYPSYKNQGYSGRIFLSEDNIIVKTPSSVPSTSTFFAQIQEKALAKLSKIKLSESNQALAEAMILGHRLNLDKTTKEEYSLSGSYHILAVSGLHVAIIFAFVNFVLSPLVLVNSGHRAINILSISLIWFYALLCGASASVMRAAFMFSALQLALFSSLRIQTLNILSASAVVTILLDGTSIFSLSFQMSYLAVFFILTCYKPIYQRVRVRNKYLNKLIQIYIVSLLASLGVAPLLASNFGYVPVLGVIFSPLVILSASVILWLGIIYLVLPLGGMAVGFGSVLNLVFDIQNSLIHSISSLSFSGTNITISSSTTLVIYCVLITLALILYTKSRAITSLNP